MLLTQTIHDAYAGLIHEWRNVIEICSRLSSDLVGLILEYGGPSLSDHIAMVAHVPFVTRSTFIRKNLFVRLEFGVKDEHVNLSYITNIDPVIAGVRYELSQVEAWTSRE